jgi:hypothetical protein
MCKVTVITGGQEQHPDEIKAQAHRHIDCPNPCPECGDAYQMHGQERENGGPGDFFNFVQGKAFRKSRATAKSQAPL